MREPARLQDGQRRIRRRCFDLPQVAGAQQYPTLPYLFSLFSDGTTRTSPAPLLGEHNDEIYCGQLGHTREELSQLADAGVI